MNYPLVVTDALSADRALRLIRQGQQLLWQGDYQQAKQLLKAIDRRLKTPPAKTFHQYRSHQARRAGILNSILIALDEQYDVKLRRAPDVRLACLEAYGPATGPSTVPLRELLGVVSAHEWRRRGIHLDALGARIHPYYGVFAPTRSEYVDLVAAAELPASSPSSSDRRSNPVELAFDIGTGTGVLAAILARRGVGRVIATDTNPRAVACAADNLRRLGLDQRVDVRRTGLFPAGRAELIVCNPPWIPARPVSLLDHAVYDEDSRMLRGFLSGLTDHLTPDGEAWLILSDLAEHLGLRTRADLLALFTRAGLVLTGRTDVRPTHPRSTGGGGPLQEARAREITSLWRLRVT
ncbi:methyltransferase [Kribbella monticola]|uniref:methyltransferase n=1 Tax=Kribbella monticola TaxID=2185285 RepID=UPI000DD3B107|nr:class I SAM-dependent methyltransferase [Kribbella monticola]